MHVSGFMHCRHKSYTIYDKAVDAWVKAVRENTVGFLSVELSWAVTIGVQTGVYRNRCVDQVCLVWFLTCAKDIKL